MLSAVESEAALVGVLAHELSHIDHGHQLRNLRNMKLAQQTFATPRAASDWQKLMGNTMFLAKSFADPFRPEDETEADADAVRWMFQLGYDPREFGKLFLRWAKRDKGPGDRIPSFFRTHPLHRERYEAVVALYEQLMKDNPRHNLYVGQKNLVELVPRTNRKFK